MADLVVNMPNKEAPSFLGYSQVTPAGSAQGSSGSTASLLSNAGELTKMAAQGWQTFVQTTDSIIKDNINKEAIAAVDQERARMGVDDAARYTRLVDLPSDQKVPTDITRAEENLKDMYGAKNQGKISDTTYWARLDNVARDLRSRYPEYREHIDNKLKQFTGATPANQVISGLIQDANRAAAASSKDTEHRMKVTEDLTRIGKWKPWMDKVDTPSLRAYLSDQNAVKYNMEMSKSELELATSQNKMTKELAIRHLAKQTQMFSDNEINDFLMTRGPDGKSLSDRFNELAANPKAGAIDESTRLQLVATMNQFQNNTIEKFKQAQRSEFKAMGLSEKEFEESFSAGLARFNTIRDAITGGKHDVLSQVKARDEVAKTNPKLALLAADPRFQYVEAMRQVGGDTLATLVFNEMNRSTPEGKVTLHQAGYLLFSPKSDLKLGQTYRELEKLGISTKEAEKTRKVSYDLVSQMITSPGLSKDARDVGFDKMFGPGQEDFITSLSQTERLRVFKDLTSSKFRDEIKKMSPEQKNQYEEWIRVNLPVALRQTLQDVASLDKNSFATVTFNPKTYTFEVKGKVGLDGKEYPVGRSLVAEDLTTVFQNVAGVLKDNGKEPAGYIRNAMQLAGIKDESSIGKAFKEEAFKTSTPATGEKAPGKLQGRMNLGAEPLALLPPEDVNQILRQGGTPTKVEGANLEATEINQKRQSALEKLNNKEFSITERYKALRDFIELSDFYNSDIKDVLDQVQAQQVAPKPVKAKRK